MTELLMFSSINNMFFGYQWKKTWQSQKSKRQFSFHDITLLGATHLHGCGFKPPNLVITLSWASQ